MVYNPMAPPPPMLNNPMGRPSTSFDNPPSASSSQAKRFWFGDLKRLRHNPMDSPSKSKPSLFRDSG
ncbi:unnamed protein product [Meloidogyne enterolobii]|uniref:Uncharacterized protein n=1 Tax=Meloidogyne enterolobii TaxID=390850 RepID=A0ACB0XZ01_MELEN